MRGGAGAQRGRGSTVPQRGAAAPRGTGGPIGNAMANASVRGRGIAPNTMIPPFGGGARAGGPIPQNQFSAAFNVMQDLINDYDDLSLTSLEDLKKKYSPAAMAKELMQAIQKNDIVTFSKFIGILETEKEKIVKLIEQHRQEEEDKEDYDEYYYDEDIPDSFASEGPIPLDEIVTLKDYIRELLKIADKAGNYLVHLAAQKVTLKQEIRYLERLLGIGFPLYQESRLHQFASFEIAILQNDELFCKAYQPFKKRGFNPYQILTTSDQKTTNSFFGIFCKNGHISPKKIEIILSRLQGSKMDPLVRNYQSPYISGEQAKEFCNLMEANTRANKEVKEAAIQKFRGLYYLHQRKVFGLVVMKLAEVEDESKLTRTGRALKHMPEGILIEVAKYL
ncbi:hypothetical protein FGO68_gene17567 [Halteria grandinella]|uniref:Uncharacterized protein n=1 Tax=Halteria grandinella TaxID=5974 RepID=A0A8J8NP24_HALGN|nr:hypothetical protein FGO68_gene17567 [Halteria grandinella]